MDVLSNKQNKEYIRLSRYSNSPIYYNRLFDKYTSAITNYLRTDTKLDELYKVEFGDTFDSIALKYYNNPTYYWIICSYNRIQDPFKTPEVGSYIKIPNLSLIEFEDRD